MASLLLAQGVPLILAGDEVGNSQGGNNNAYCQDDEIGWVDWSALGRDGDDMTGLVAQLTDIRRRFPQLRPRHWVDGRREDGSFGALWLTPQGNEMTEQDWNFPEGRFLSYVLGAGRTGSRSLFIVLNSAPEAIEFTLPTIPQYNTWTAILNTAAGSQRSGKACRQGGNRKRRRAQSLFIRARNECEDDLRATTASRRRDFPPLGTRRQSRGADA